MTTGKKKSKTDHQEEDNSLGEDFFPAMDLKAEDDDNVVETRELYLVNTPRDSLVSTDVIVTDNVNEDINNDLSSSTIAGLMAGQSAVCFPTKFSKLILYLLLIVLALI